MTIEIVKEVLAKCIRSELRDHYFGDREISWQLNGKDVAEAYMGKEAEFHFTHNGIEFDTKNSNLISDLIKLGTIGNIERNDSTGDSTYRGA